MEIQEITESCKVLRVFAHEYELDFASSQLLKRAKEIAAPPVSMSFHQTMDYEETSRYQVLLYCG